LAEQFRVNIDANGDPLHPNEVTEKNGPSVDITSIHSFDATVRMMENVATERKPSATAEPNTRSVVVAALGDALANTHFFTGGGMSIGKCNV
jgi:2-polyprenyl-6-methoxyphenol hydroxylase-like FAD-dependent oxidoreductase